MRTHQIELVNASSDHGDDFLASVCKEWEAATEPAAAAGIRVVALRTGLVLAREGGVLAKMLLPFRLGLGGRLGSGRQWMSCIALSDYIALTEFCIAGESIAGPLNLVGPAPVTNDEFVHTLARVLGRPALFPVPRVALKLANGQWLVSDASDGPSVDWREMEFVIAALRWRKLNPATITESAGVEHPDLSRV